MLMGAGVEMSRKMKVAKPFCQGGAEKTWDYCHGESDNPLNRAI